MECSRKTGIVGLHICSSWAGNLSVKIGLLENGIHRQASQAMYIWGNTALSIDLHKQIAYACRRRGGVCAGRLANAQTSRGDIHHTSGSCTGQHACIECH